MNVNENFSSEQTLAQRYNNEIQAFWQQGNFSSFLGFNNVRINYATFIAPENKKNLVIVQGRSESYLKYQETIFDLFHQGYNIFIHDHRGQGLSGRLLANPFKGYVDNFDDYVEDLHQFITNFVLPECKQNKLYLLAHSMGGAISSLYLAKYPNVITASTLLAPMFGINTGIIPKPLATTIIHSTAFFERLLPNSPLYFFGQGDHRVRSFEGNSLTHSVTRYNIYKELYLHEKVIQLGGVTTHWLKQGHRIINKVVAKIHTLSTPVLILQAGSDTVIDNQAQHIFHDELPLYKRDNNKFNKALIVIENAKHELLFEQDKYRNQAISHMLEWFNE